MIIANEDRQFIVNKDLILYFSCSFFLLFHSILCAWKCWMWKAPEWYILSSVDEVDSLDTSWFLPCFDVLGSSIVLSNLICRKRAIVSVVLVVYDFYVREFNVTELLPLNFFGLDEIHLSWFDGLLSSSEKEVNENA